MKLPIKEILLCAIFLLTSAGAIADKGYPTVRFDYGFVPFDRACSQVANYEIKTGKTK